MSYLKTPNGAIINLAAFASITMERTVPEGQVNACGDWAIMGQHPGGLPVPIYQGTQDVCAKLFNAIDARLIPQTQAAPPVLNYGDCIRLTRADVARVVEALALHRSMAQCGESPTVKSWEAYGKAMEILGNEGGVENAKYSIAALRPKQRDAQEPMVRIVRTGILSGTDCPTEISLRILEPFKEAVLGICPYAGTFENVAVLDGWKLYDALNPPPADHKSLSCMEDARAVAQFLKSLLFSNVTKESREFAWFPIIRTGLSNELFKACPAHLPWLAISPFAKRAEKNHGQTLERLAERGGLAPHEAWAVMTEQDVIGPSGVLQVSAREAVEFLVQIAFGPQGSRYAQERAAGCTCTEREPSPLCPVHGPQLKGTQ